MTWSWAFGCANGCTWQETAAVCGLAVLASAVFLAWLCWIAHKEAEKHNEDIK